LLSRLRSKRVEELAAHFSSELERISRAAAFPLAELQALSREITALGDKLDLKFDYDHVAGTNALLTEVARRYPGWWQRETSVAADYRKIVRAIIREAQALAAAAQGGEEAGKPLAAVCPDKMGAAEAYAVLGPTMRPTGGDRPSLLQAVRGVER
jgi:hypothetical protein